MLKGIFPSTSSPRPLTALFISLLLISGCDKPAPTELFDDSSEDEYEVLTKNLDDQYYNSGVDTSGMVQDLRGLTNIISVSGIKITNDNETFNLSLAQAIFFDRSKPVYYSDGTTLLAYETVTPGLMRFDNHLARIVPFRIRYRDLGVPMDTVVGNRYVLWSGFGGTIDPFIFPYNSSVNVLFDPILFDPISFDIPTPPEINGNVFLRGRRIDRNLEAVLEWNGLGHRKITLIIGVKRKNSILTVPIYKIRTGDDGEVIVPKRFFSELPLHNFDKLVITFIRSYEGLEETGANKLLVSTQSIHSIVIDIP
jgi:hypothetical protein